MPFNKLHSFSNSISKSDYTDLPELLIKITRLFQQYLKENNFIAELQDPHGDNFSMTIFHPSNLDHDDNNIHFEIKFRAFS
ncbi:hypothetical protein [Ferruginibacter sp.]|nr:hypothetical protein [Ferruginibacter sp.]